MRLREALQPHPAGSPCSFPEEAEVRARSRREALPAFVLVPMSYAHT